MEITFVTFLRIPLFAKLRASCQHRPKRTLMPNSRHSLQQSSSPGATSEGQAGSESLDAAVFCADVQGQFSSCNSGFVRLFGYSAAEVIGRDFSALFKDKNGNLLGKTVLSETVNEGNYHCQLTAQPKSGTSFAVEFSATLLRDARSAPTAIVVLVAPAKN